jgi:hypothetical protein
MSWFVIFGKTLIICTILESFSQENKPMIIEFYNKRCKVKGIKTEK